MRRSKLLSPPPLPRSDEPIMSLQHEPAKLSPWQRRDSNPVPRCVALANQRLRPLGHRGRKKKECRVMDRNFSENIVLVHFVITCAFLFPAATLVNALLNLI